MAEYGIFPNDTVISPARRCFAITPNDVVLLATLPKAIRAPSDGIITLRAVDSTQDVAHPVLEGERLDVRAQFIRATGTTVAGTIVGCA